MSERIISSWQKTKTLISFLKLVSTLDHSSTSSSSLIPMMRSLSKGDHFFTCLSLSLSLCCSMNPLIIMFHHVDQWISHSHFVFSLFFPIISMGFIRVFIFFYYNCSCWAGKVAQTPDGHQQEWREEGVDQQQQTTTSTRRRKKKKWGFNSCCQCCWRKKEEEGRRGEEEGVQQLRREREDERKKERKKEREKGSQTSTQLVVVSTDTLLAHISLPHFFFIPSFLRSGVVVVVGSQREVRSKKKKK